jgi:hypothetical protein
MSEVFYTRSGDRYTKRDDNTYWYYDNSGFKLIKTQKEIDDLNNKWGNTEWGIYYAVVIICIIVFSVLAWSFWNDSTFKWVFFILACISGSLFIAPFVAPL